MRGMHFLSFILGGLVTLFALKLIESPNKDTNNFTLKDEIQLAKPQLDKEIQANSSNQDKLRIAILENEIWTKVRIDPTDLPTGELEVIPALEFIRLGHKELKAYKAMGNISEKDGITTYILTYPDLERTLTINFTTDFPYSIESWTEEFKSGFGPNAKLLTTKATKLKQMKTAYWGQNSNQDLFLRDSLGL